MSEKKTYQIAYVVCSNCNHIQKVEFEGKMQPITFHILIGTTTKHFLQHKDCMNCGCRGFLYIR